MVNKEIIGAATKTEIMEVKEATKTEMAVDKEEPLNITEVLSILRMPQVV